jgi:hypothetical protein
LGADSTPIRQKALSAWAIGTAVKNDYDYQLWVLETVNITNHSHDSFQIVQKSGLQLLVDLLISMPKVADEDSVAYDIDDVQRKALYAISAAVRGNPDVQQALMSIKIPVHIALALVSPVTFSSYDDSIATTGGLQVSPDVLSSLSKSTSFSDYIYLLGAFN